jgi:hypothetical protein
MFHWNKHEQHMLPFPEWLYGAGAKPIIINSNGMNIHLPAILM